MVVLFGTLGFHPAKLLAAIPSVGLTIERAVIYTGVVGEGEERSLSDEALRDVTRTLDTLGVPAEHREFTSPWAYREMLETLVRDLHQYPPDGVVFNLTGGPKSMTVAAAMACLMLGIRVIYVLEELGGPGKVIELPLLRIRYGSVLTPSQWKILKTIRDGRPVSLDDLSKQLRRKAATVSYHVDNLLKLGAVRLAQDENRRTTRIPFLTETGEVMLLAH
ncbi:MAG: MarR family transcriptional regulator, partial [Dehalococcoidia bacterium]